MLAHQRKGNMLVVVVRLGVIVGDVGARVKVKHVYLVRVQIVEISNNKDQICVNI